ncbi:MAG: ABC transporter transmembrane domain-containing protein, partial [Litoreibacter sp.]
MSSMSSSDTSPMRYVLPPVGAAVWTSTLTLNILGLATPLVMLQLFDRIIPFQSHETLKMLVAGLCCVAAVELFQRMLRVRILIDQAKSEFTTLNAKLTERVVKADPIALTNTSSVSLFAQLQSASGIRDLISSTGRLHIIEVPFSAIAIASIWLIGGALILVPVIGLGILVLLGLFVRHQQKYLIEERTEADRARYDLLSNALKKISVVKSSQMEVGLKTMYRRLQLSSAKASHAAILSSGLFQNASLVIGQAFSSAMVLTGAYFVITGRIGAAELAACTMLNGRAVQPALQLIKVWASGETTDAIRRHASEGLLLPAAPRGLSNKRQLSGAIAFEDVTVRTSRSGRAVLRSLSFAVPENGFAWVESNSGASTTAMMHVLMGQTVPEKGQVLIDNRPPRSLMTHRGCGGLVYINEDPTIFDGTILENVA